MGTSTEKQLRELLDSLLEKNFDVKKLCISKDKQSCYDLTVNGMNYELDEKNQIFCFGTQPRMGDMGNMLIKEDIDELIIEINQTAKESEIVERFNYVIIGDNDKLYSAGHKETMEQALETAESVKKEFADDNFNELLIFKTVGKSIRVKK